MNLKECYIKQIIEATGLSLEDIQILINEKVKKYKDLASEEGIVFIIAKELAIDLRYNKNQIGKESEAKSLLKILRAGNTLMVYDLIYSNSIKRLSNDEIIEILFDSTSNFRVSISKELNSVSSYKSLVLPILKQFSKRGITVAQKILRGELIRIFENGELKAIQYLIIRGYLKFLPKEVIEKLLSQRESNLKKNLIGALGDKYLQNEYFAFSILRALSDYGISSAKLMMREQFIQTGSHKIWLNYL